MGIIGKLISNKIETFILNTVEKRFGYNVKGETYGPSGDDSPGLEDDRVYLGSIDGEGRSVVIGNLVISQGAEAGEKILYSRDANGNVKAKIYLDKTGKLIISTDAAMEFVAGGDISFTNDLGTFKLQNSDGQFNVNNANLTVDV